MNIIAKKRIIKIILDVAYDKEYTDEALDNEEYDKKMMK